MRRKAIKETLPRVGSEESEYRFCKDKKRKGYIIHKAICEQRCNNKRCSVVRERIRNEKSEERLKNESKNSETKGISRSLLLKPEDVVDVKPRKKSKK